jgi:pimeloyl-ACP methyl ester carboxylesterase
MKDPKFVEVGGIRTRYFEAGEGEPLVLIHGGNIAGYSHSYDWSLNFDELGKHFHVYALDKLGQGHTDIPRKDADYTMAATIEHVHGFLAAAGIRKAVLVGHSRGALPAARIAIDHPELVGALVIVDTNTLAADHPSTPKDFYTNVWANPPPVLDAAYARREADANSWSRDHITPDFVDAWLQVSLLPKTEEAARKMKALSDKQFLPDLQRQKYDTLDLIREGRLKAPTLVVWGLNDPSAPIVLGHQLFQQIAFALPRAQLHVFNHAGHYVYREHPRDFDRVLIDFVRAADGS